MSHSNFGVYETTDEYDETLHKTVADLKNPPQVPHEAPPHAFVTYAKPKLRTKGYPLSSTERFVKE